MITSVQNPKIKQIRALQARAKARREAGAYIVEGVRLAEEALRAGLTPQLALYTEELGERGQALVAALQASKVPVEMIAPHVMQTASDTQSPQGVLLELPMKPLPLPDELDFVVIADQLRDPGNLGTLLRSASAAGVQAVLLPPDGVDPYAPKVMRAGMGAHFRLPVQILPYDEITAVCRKHHLQIMVSAARQGTPYYQVDLTTPLALVIGGEAEGAGAEIAAQAGRRIHIPMPGESESLNAAAAAAVLLFETVRQRNAAG